jgi:hypothetical protein
MTDAAKAAFEWVQNLRGFDNKSIRDVFWDLPDPMVFPDYYSLIQRPICLAHIARKVHGTPPSDEASSDTIDSESSEEGMASSRGGRFGLSALMRDLRRMSSNAKRYNSSQSRAYQYSLGLDRAIIALSRFMTVGGQLTPEEHHRAWRGRGTASPHPPHHTQAISAALPRKNISAWASSSGPPLHLLMSAANSLELALEASDESDEESDYARSVRHRPTLEAQEREVARQVRERNGAMRAAEFLSGPRKDSPQWVLVQVQRALESDPHVLMRGAESYIGFHEKRLGRSLTSLAGGSCADPVRVSGSAKALWWRAAGPQGTAPSAGGARCSTAWWAGLELAIGGDSPADPAQGSSCVQAALEDADDHVAPPRAVHSLIGAGYVRFRLGGVLLDEALRCWCPAVLAPPPASMLPATCVPPPALPVAPPPSLPPTKPHGPSFRQVDVPSITPPPPETQAPRSPKRPRESMLPAVGTQLDCLFGEDWYPSRVMHAVSESALRSIVRGRILPSHAAPPVSVARTAVKHALPGCLCVRSTLSDDEEWILVGSTRLAPLGTFTGIEGAL